MLGHIFFRIIFCENFAIFILFAVFYHLQAKMSDTEVLQSEVAENLKVSEDADSGITYPLKVQYCGECSMPLEYCSFSGHYDKCKAWREKNVDQLASEGIKIVEDEDDANDEKKRRKRGGKGQVKSVKVCSEQLLISSVGY